MTLDEAIIHAEEVAERLENSHKRDWMCEDDERCAKEHRQLALWLKDLKRLKEQGSVLDKIRAEIEQRAKPNELGGRGNGKSIRYGLCMALEIIDKYRAEGRVNAPQQNRIPDNECMFSDYTDMPYQFDNMTGSMNL